MNDEPGPCFFLTAASGVEYIGEPGHCLPGQARRIMQRLAALYAHSSAEQRLLDAQGETGSGFSAMSCRIGSLLSPLVEQLLGPTTR
ncbi:MAG TPA: hypothetical protein VFV02_08505 [Acidimicrobiales bacterium]|nr:hypothetical protein [Acidimicrobiales bacterium]